MNLGMVGLGRMGANMTERLREHDHTVETYARTNPERTAEDMGGYWPSYLFNEGKVGQRVAPKVGMPIGGGQVGQGGRNHAANEYYVIEGAGNTYGMAAAEKSVATTIYNYLGLN